MSIGETVVHLAKTYALKFVEEGQYREHGELVGTFDRLRWRNEDNGLIYTIDGQISLENMLEMAESIILSGQSEGSVLEEP